MASWSEARNEERDADAYICLACGVRLQQTLDRLGSLRCLDCRAENKPLNPELVRRWQSSGAQL